MLCYKICYWFSEWIEFLHITRRHLFSDPVFFIMIQSENIYIVDFLLGILSVRFVWRSEIMQLYGKFNRSRPRLCKRYICIIFSAHCLIGNIHSLILKFSSIQRLLGIPTISIYPLLDFQSLKRYVELGQIDFPWLLLFRVMWEWIWFPLCACESF